MQLFYHLLFWSLMEVTSASKYSLLQAAVMQVMYEIENDIFKAFKKCDVYIAESKEITELVNFGNLENPVILINEDAKDHENFNRLAKMNSNCLILLMSVKNHTDITLVRKIVSSKIDSIVINLSLSNTQVTSILSKYTLDRFPRNILEITANELPNHVSLKIICMQNLDHVSMKNVNLWIARNGPVKPLTYTMPNSICPHPLYKKKLKAGYFISRPFVFPKQSAEYGLGGFEISLLKLLREKFQFEVSFLKDVIGEYNITSKKWTGMFKMLFDGELDIRICQCIPRLAFDYTRSIFYAEYKWLSRKPIPVAKYDQFLIQFSKSVWAATIATLLVLSVLFAVFYKIYQGQSFNGLGLTGYLATPADFLLITMSALMEPDPMCWFPRFSAGRLLVLLWCIFALNINNFYNCNLRADLMRQDYEKAIETSADVLERDQTVYLQLSMYNAFFKNQKFENPNVQKVISSLVLDRKGVYDNLASSGGFPEYVRKDIFDKGSTLLFMWQRILGESLNDKTMSPGKLHVGKEIILVSNQGYCLRKDTTWKNDFDRIILRTFDMGIIDHFIHQELPQKGYMPAPKGDASDEVKPIKLEQIMSIGFFLLAGFCISIIAIIFELFALLAK